MSRTFSCLKNSPFYLADIDNVARAQLLDKQFVYGFLTNDRDSPEIFGAAIAPATTHKRAPKPAAVLSCRGAIARNSLIFNKIIEVSHLLFFA